MSRRRRAAEVRERRRRRRNIGRRRRRVRRSLLRKPDRSHEHEGKACPKQPNESHEIPPRTARECQVAAKQSRPPSHSPPQLPNAAPHAHSLWRAEFRTGSSQRREGGINEKEFCDCAARRRIDDFGLASAGNTWSTTIVVLLIASSFAKSRMDGRMPLARTVYNGWKAAVSCSIPAS